MTGAERPLTARTARLPGEASRGAGAGPGTVSVHIERLVLDGLGLTSQQGAAVSRSFEDELQTLLGGPAARMAWSGGALAVAVARATRIPSSTPPAELGRALARSVLASLEAMP